MHQIALFSLLGLGEGSLIAGVAIALVLFYRGSGVINLAAGAVAMVSGYGYWALKTGFFGPHFSTPLALAITVLISLAQGVIMEFGAFRPLRTAPPLAKLVGSLGVFLFAQSAMLLIFGPNDQSEPTLLPQNAVNVLGSPIPLDQFILAGIVVATAAVLWAAYRWSSFGLQTRAASESEESAMMIGLSPQLLSLANTMLACLVAGMLGVLAAPLITLDSTTLPLLVVPALAATLFARFTSFGVACFLGLVLGALENVLYYLSTLSWFPKSDGVALPGIMDMVIFLLIVLGTFVMGRRLPRRGDLTERRLPSVPIPRNLLRWSVVALVVGAAALTLFPYDFRQSLMTSIISSALALSLVVITGFVGQVSVVQLALSGGTGFLMAHLARNFGIGFPLAPIIAVAATTVLGVAIAIGALRVRGVQLAVVTLAAAVAMSSFWFINPSWGGGISGAVVSQPHLLGLNLGNTASFRGLDGHQPSPILGYGILVVTILLSVLVAGQRRSNVGRRMLAVRSNERAAAAIGIDVARVKIFAFATSSFIAGVAGALYAYNFGSVSSDLYDPITAFTVIAFAYIGGITMVSGAAIAGLFATQGLAQYALQKWFGISGVWVLLLGGWAVLSNVVFWPEGLAGGVYQRVRRNESSSQSAASRAPSTVPPDVGIEVEGMRGGS